MNSNTAVRIGLWIMVASLMGKNSVAQGNRIDLSGKWGFRIDSLDAGIVENWFAKNFQESIQLPGSMTSNGKGNDIDLNTPWMGSIINKNWYTEPEYAKYRVQGNIKIPFWLQPVKYYKGPAWYQKDIIIPGNWQGKSLELLLERCHWETQVWIDGRPAGIRNSLSTPHLYFLRGVENKKQHRITIRVDNRVKDVNVGPDSHSLTDHTQTNWNGIIGEISLRLHPTLGMQRVQLFPDIHKKIVRVLITVNNSTKGILSADMLLNAVALDSKKKSPGIIRTIQADTGLSVIEAEYPMGKNVLLWDEFHPNLYRMEIKIQEKGKKIDSQSFIFGMREFGKRETQFTINGRLTFLRGTLECAIFPKTGYPPVDSTSWNRIFRICRLYGLNHMRFHSWCPPEAAFVAADKAGFYLQVECGSWANTGAVIGDGKPLDTFIYEESERIVNAYGNHPSFCMMAYGNEPAGVHHVDYLRDFVTYWRKKDSRRLYTTAAGWPVLEESDYNNTHDPRIQQWDEGLMSIINSKPPSSDYDWSSIISKWKQPTVSHEIGQWCVYPDFTEIPKYTGVLKAKNFEIFREKLESNGMKNLANQFLLASGKLQVLCYKADIEAALRTPGFGGFQLLDLHDFPGQGTALVGVLNAFWEDKGYITGKQYSRFCNAVVPLALLPKMVFKNSERLIAAVRVANFSKHSISEKIKWSLRNTDGNSLFSGELSAGIIPVGNKFSAGGISQDISSIKRAGRYILTLGVGAFKNSWDIFIYPDSLPVVDSTIYVTQKFDSIAFHVLEQGGKVFYTLRKGDLKPEMGGNIQIGFSSIFWNTAWTKDQPPVSLGLLCDPTHEAFREFPTEYHSNYQWQDGMSHSNAVIIDSVSKELKPIVRVIDDWVTARSLALVFECRVGKGKLLVSGIDLQNDLAIRPEARQLRYSLLKYMEGSLFDPLTTVNAGSIRNLTRL